MRCLKYKYKITIDNNIAYLIKNIDDIKYVLKIMFPFNNCKNNKYCNKYCKLGKLEDCTFFMREIYDTRLSSYPLNTTIKYYFCLGFDILGIII
jgi:hypothetical protein